MAISTKPQLSLRTNYPPPLDQESKFINNITGADSRRELIEQVQRVEKDYFVKLQEIKVVTDRLADSGMLPFYFSKDQLRKIDCVHTCALTQLMSDLVLNADRQKTLTPGQVVNALKWLAVVDPIKAADACENIDTQKISSEIADWRREREKILNLSALPAASVTSSNDIKLIQPIRCNPAGVNEAVSSIEKSNAVTPVRYMDIQLSRILPVNQNAEPLKNALRDLNYYYKNKHKPDLSALLDSTYQQRLFPVKLTPEFIERFDSRLPDQSLCDNLEKVIQQFLLEMIHKGLIREHLRSGIVECINWLCIVEPSLAKPIVINEDIQDADKKNALSFAKSHFYQNIKSRYLPMAWSEATAAPQHSRFGVNLSTSTDEKTGQKKPLSTDNQVLVNVLALMNAVWQSGELDSLVQLTAKAYADGFFPLKLTSDFYRQFIPQKQDEKIAVEQALVEFVASFAPVTHTRVRTGLMSSIYWLACVNPALAETLCEDIELRSNWDFSSYFSKVTKQIERTRERFPDPKPTLKVLPKQVSAVETDFTPYLKTAGFFWDYIESAIDFNDRLVGDLINKVLLNGKFKSSANTRLLLAHLKSFLIFKDGYTMNQTRLGQNCFRFMLALKTSDANTALYRLLDDYRQSHFE